MSLKERTLAAADYVIEKAEQTKIGGKIIFAGKMGFSSQYRDQWLTKHLEKDTREGVVTADQAALIFEQSQKSQTSRHFGEAFAIPLLSYAVAGISSACIAYYAWETNDALAWGYTLSHFAQGVPKLSISSLTRAASLGVSIGYDHIKDKEIGSLNRLAGEAAAILTSGISWVGAGNAGPVMRLGLYSADLGGYLSKEMLKAGSKKPEAGQPKIQTQYLLPYLESMRLSP